VLASLHDLIQQFSDLFVHLPDHLETVAREYHNSVYLLLGGIVFCETGLVVTPFLPGDSLLFGCGSLAARGILSVPLLWIVFVGAALLGDTCNYFMGRILGPRILRGERLPLINRKSLDRTRAFFAKHGGKSVIIARFIPIVRTFAPFTAGVGLMPYPRFLAFSLTGALLWVGICVTAGWALGNIPFVKQNFSIVVIAIIMVSLIPVLIGAVRAWREGRTARNTGTPPTANSARDAA
jgi:membrane-associated protein